MPALADPDNSKQPKRLFRFDPTWLFVLGSVGLLSFVHPALEPFRWLMLLLLVPTLRPFFTSESEEEQKMLPLPGPAQKYGARGMYLRVLLSNTAVALNPFQLVQVTAQTVGQLLVLLRWQGRLPTASSYQQQCAYRLPVSGRWLIYKGGITRETSHSWEIVTQRYAYDFVRSDQSSRRHRGDGTEVEDYYAYGEPILAPAAGTVVRVRNGVRDAPDPGTGYLDAFSRDFRGNFIVIQHAESEYSFLAHLIPATILVKPGDHVVAGQEVGRCGNSGHSTEPHLHFHVQDHPNFFLAAGLPVRFSNVKIEGGAGEEDGYLTGPVVVEGDGSTS